MLPGLEYEWSEWKAVATLPKYTTMFVPPPISRLPTVIDPAPPSHVTFDVSPGMKPTSYVTRNYFQIWCQR